MGLRMAMQQKDGWSAAAMPEVNDGLGGFDLAMSEGLGHPDVVLQFSPQRQFFHPKASHQERRSPLSIWMMPFR
jgi:hypothetical protein